MREGDCGSAGGVHHCRQVLVLALVLALDLALVLALVLATSPRSSQVRGSKGHATHSLMNPRADFWGYGVGSLFGGGQLG